MNRVFDHLHSSMNAIHSCFATLPNAAKRQNTLSKSHAIKFKNGLIQPCGPTAQKHKAFKLLEEYAYKGCPVNCRPNWSMDHIIEVLKYGAHLSARQGEALNCLKAESLEKENKGFVHIYKWNDIKHKIPAKFKLSPIAMIPHKS